MGLTLVYPKPKFYFECSPCNNVLQRYSPLFAHGQGGSSGIQKLLSIWDEAVDICDFTAVTCLLSDELPFSEAAFSAISPFIIIKRNPTFDSAAVPTIHGDLQDFKQYGVTNNIDCSPIKLIRRCQATMMGHNGHTHHSLLTDKAALLAFKSTIKFDPNCTIAGWGTTLMYAASEVSDATNTITVHLLCLQLDENNLQGPIPESFALLSKLRSLTLSENSLTEALPPSFFRNCTSLANLDLSLNFFTGKIPQEIGNSPHLWSLNLYNNQFVGQLPASLVNTSIYNLDVGTNNLSGELPSVILGKLSLLKYLQLSYNNMISHDNNSNLKPFFTALENCTSLVELQLVSMGLGGRLPSSISQLNITKILLQENQITGSIPPSIANLSYLMTLNLTSNHLNGKISSTISRLSKLEQLFLSHNLFSREIPAVLGQLPHLCLLDLSYNNFSGPIPESLGNLIRLNYLFLNNNLLSGSIPRTLGQCIDLYKLDLSYNRLTGRLPPEISGIHAIRIFLNLSHNHLEGPLPIEFSKLENVQEIDLSSNKFTGNIFTQISSCIALTLLNLSHNALEGKLPESLGDLKNLVSLDVSENYLSGMILTSLSKMYTLTFINLSFNQFEGRIPTGGIFDSVTNMSFLGNPGLCGAVPEMPICSEKRHWFHSHMYLIIFISVICISALLTAICCKFKFYLIKILISAKSETIRRQKTPELKQNFPRITYRELSKATREFDERMLIGTGSYGRVYKGILSDGRAIAVKSPEERRMWHVAIGELIDLGILCTQESPSTRPTMLDAADDLDRLKRYVSYITFAFLYS
ncbi:hypothetical protein Pint_30366 [Pistacia integerrima]|uniref:Uncharacterized protein n=1 Tax=Pistacia integerrima TaxID=434235 RepID=A0ACC0WZS6_9ROSI|nr:hypothetical protein Pint_30366 [Pistacia integerrima]